MLNRARAKSASVAVALLVTAILGAPAFATDQPDGGGNGVTTLAKPTNKPRPSHPHATPTPGPTRDAETHTHPDAQDHAEADHRARARGDASNDGSAPVGFGNPEAVEARFGEP